MSRTLFLKEGLLFLVQRAFTPRVRTVVIVSVPTALMTLPSLALRAWPILLFVLKFQTRKCMVPSRCTSVS